MFNTIAVLSVLLFSVSSFGQVTSRYCDENNLRANIAAHIFGHSEVLQGNMEFAAYSDKAMESLGLAAIAKRSLLLWDKVEIKSCQDDSERWGSAEVEFEVRNVYLVDPANQDSFSGGEIIIAGKLNNDLFYETVEIGCKFFSS